MSFFVLLVAIDIQAFPGYDISKHLKKTRDIKQTHRQTGHNYKTKRQEVACMAIATRNSITRWRVGVDHDRQTDSPSLACLIMRLEPAYILSPHALNEILLDVSSSSK